MRSRHEAIGVALSIECDTYYVTPKKQIVPRQVQQYAVSGFRKKRC